MGGIAFIGGIFNMPKLLLHIITATCLFFASSQYSAARDFTDGEPVLALQKTGDQTSLQWTHPKTNASVNSYEVERSDDGVTFRTVAILYKELASYSEKGKYSKCHYRIKVLYEDFSVTYSNTCR